MRGTQTCRPALLRNTNILTLGLVARRLRTEIIFRIEVGVDYHVHHVV